MKSVLLVSPDFDIESFWISNEKSAKTVRNDLPPLGLATLAAMIPESYEVTIWDEVVHGKITAETEFDYDLIGITGYNNHYPRVVELATFFNKKKKKDALLIVGGPGVSGMPEKYRQHFDVLFIGEAERTWPQFLKDWPQGVFKTEYRQIEKINLAESPLPKWDSIKSDMKKYLLGTVQTRRGCPNDCEFCDVIYLFGRQVRQKPIENVVEEVKTLERLGVSGIAFCDDEFVGNTQYTKDLLRALIPVNNSFKRPLSYVTQISMNVSKDNEILELLADLNFSILFIGIETPNKDSLRETNKHHNIREDLVEDVKKILSYGLSIRAGLIVGFDHDGLDIFDTMDKFVHDACLPSATLSMLKAIPGTRLWRRLRQEGRVLDISKIKGDSKDGDAFKTRSYTNIIPQSMTRVQLMEGYKKLAVKLYSWSSFCERMKGFVSNIKRQPNVTEPAYTEAERASVMKVCDLWPDAKEAIEQILVHTENVAPFMMRKVSSYIIQHATQKKTFAKILPDIDRLVELESTGKMPFELDQRPVPIPESFRKMFKKGDFFREMYNRVYNSVTDKRRVPEALCEIFIDFITRWGSEFKEFEPYHLVFLHELSDRTSKKINQEAVGEREEGQRAAQQEPVVKLAGLADDILRNIEIELICKNKVFPSASGNAA